MLGGEHMLKQLKGMECNFCSRPATKDVLGEIEIFANRLVKMHLCDACYKSYLTGNKFGQLQVHQNVISLISSCDNESPVLDLKMKLEESYGSIANVRLFSKGMSLQPIVTEAVQHLFGKK